MKKQIYASAALALFISLLFSTTAAAGTADDYEMHIDADVPGYVMNEFYENLPDLVATLNSGNFGYDAYSIIGEVKESDLVLAYAKRQYYTGVSAYEFPDNCDSFTDLSTAKDKTDAENGDRVISRYIFMLYCKGNMIVTTEVHFKNEIGPSWSYGGLFAVAYTEVMEKANKAGLESDDIRIISNIMGTVFVTEIGGIEYVLEYENGEYLKLHKSRDVAAAMKQEYMETNSGIWSRGAYGKTSYTAYMQNPEGWDAADLLQREREPGFFRRVYLWAVSMLVES